MMYLLRKVFNRARHEWYRVAAAIGGAARWAFRLVWPALWWAIAGMYAALPDGRIRRGFRNLVYTRPWRTFHRKAYIPQLRDLYFEYIATFFYEYPIRKGDVVVQIGASFGEETTRFARAVGKTGRVIAIEPAPSNYTRLQAQFTQETFPQVTVVPVGAWRAPGTVAFFLGGEREHRLAELPGGALTYEWWGVEDHLDPSRYKETIPVPVDTVENILRKLGVGRVDFVLVETNGSEPEVVEGIGSALNFVRRVNARGHVARDGVPIHREMADFLQARGFAARVNDEGMVIAHRGR